MSEWPGRGRAPWLTCNACGEGVSVTLCELNGQWAVCDRCWPKLDLRVARTMGFA